MDNMAEDKKEDRKEELEERIKALESQLSFFIEKERKDLTRLKSLKGFFTSAGRALFSRNNLELFLSLAALTVSVLTAYIVLYR